MTLIDRLWATRDVPVVQRPLCAMPRTLISVVDKVYINPDGPEAAAALETMLEALEGADEALRDHACHGGPNVPCIRDEYQCGYECGKSAGDALLKVIAAIAKVKEG